MFNSETRLSKNQALTFSSHPVISTIPPSVFDTTEELLLRLCGPRAHTMTGGPQRDEVILALAKFVENDHVKNLPEWNELRQRIKSFREGSFLPGDAIDRAQEVKAIIIICSTILARKKNN